MIKHVKRCKGYPKSSNIHTSRSYAETAIKEGDKLLVEGTEHGQVILAPIRKLEDCAGIYSKYAKPEEMKKHIDMLREEY